MDQHVYVSTHPKVSFMAYYGVITFYFPSFVPTEQGHGIPLNDETRVSWDHQCAGPTARLPEQWQFTAGLG